MKLETENNKKAMKAIKNGILTAITFLCMVVGFVTIWQLVTRSGNTSAVNPSEEVSSSCAEAGGVVVRGVHQHGDGYNRFTVCIPYEALTCIDVE